DRPRLRGDHERADTEPRGTAGAQQHVFVANASVRGHRDLRHVELAALGAFVQGFDVVEHELVVRRHRAEDERVVRAGRDGQRQHAPLSIQAMSEARAAAAASRSLQLARSRRPTTFEIPRISPTLTPITRAAWTIAAPSMD